MIKTLLIKENIDVLQRFLNVIEVLSDSQYVNTDSSLYSSSIGAHARHVIDHYQAFIDGVKCGHINYDNRGREVLLEHDRAAVSERIRYLIGELEQLQTVDGDTRQDIPQAGTALNDSCDDNFLNRTIMVTMDIASLAANVEQAPQQSSIARELAFLHSHTTHHQALVGFIMRVLNIAPLPADMGLAPATIKHREAAGCAR